MSFVTGTNVELLYTSLVAGAAKASFTTEIAINDTATMGAPPQIPPFFFAPQYGTGKAIQVVARGILSSTGTPTYTFSLRLGAQASITSVIALGSAALTTGSGVTNQIWTFDGIFTMKTLTAAGATSTIVGVGEIRSSGTANKIDPLYGGGATPGTATTLDISITNFFNFNVACSASSASNSITLQKLDIFGLN